MRKILLSGAAAALLMTTTACDPATLGIAAAGMALDALTSSPADAAANSAPNIMDQLSGLNDQVSESCLAKIEQGGTDVSQDPKDVEISTRGGATQSATSEAVVAGTEEVTVDDVTVDEAAADTDVPEMRSTTTTANLSSESEKACQLQLVCLPGNSSPVVMMMCAEDTVVADAEAADGETATVSAPLPAPEIDTTPKEVTWAWNAEEEETDTAAEVVEDEEVDITTETAAP